MEKYLVFQKDRECEGQILAKAGERVHISGEDSFNYYLDLCESSDLLLFGVAKKQYGSLYQVIKRK